MRMVEMIKDFSYNGIAYKKGKKYVMAEDSEAKLRSVLSDNMGMSFPIDPIYRKYKGEDLTNKKIMAWRTGGLGDMGFLSPALRYLKNKYKGCFIRFASGCRALLENLPEIDELYDMPFDADLLNNVDYHLFFQGIIESSSEDSKHTHAVDMFFKYFSIDSIQLPAEDKRPRVIYNKQELDWLDNELKVLGLTEKDYVIGIQMETSAPLRNFPKEKFKNIIDILSKENGVKIVLIGSPQQEMMGKFYKQNVNNIIIATKYSPRQSVILVNRYNQVIAPDSFIIQAAGALGKPLIGLYGPFSSDVRMKYFKNAIGIEPRVVCSPCYKHDYKPCIKGFPSPCFSQIKVEDVLQAIDYQKYKFTRQHFSFMESFLKSPDFSEIEKYFLGADKGLCFFPGYYKHPNMIRADFNEFVKPDIKDMSQNFQRNWYPFVLFMNNFNSKTISIYENSKGMVRPGGYFIVYKDNATEQLYNEIKKDIGKSFIMLYSKIDPISNVFIIVGKKRY